MGKILLNNPSSDNWYTDLLPWYGRLMAYTLYPWQDECIDTWLENRGRGIVRVVTGAGKTILALHAALRLQKTLNENLHIVVVVPKTFLLNQWKNAILSELPIRREEIGLVGGGFQNRHAYKVMLYVVNSARSRLSLPLYRHLMADKPVFLIADECHHYTSAENRKIFAFLDSLPTEKKHNYYCLGLSATPKVEPLRNYMGPLIYSYSFSEAIAHKVINRVAIFNVGLRLDPDQAGEYETLSLKIFKAMRTFLRQNPTFTRLSKAEFYSTLQALANRDDPLAKRLANLLLRRRHLINTAYQRIDAAFDLIALLPGTSRILVFTERIDQSELLYERLKEEYPSQTALYHSELTSDENTLALRRYQSGEARILVSCKALDEGLDVPSTDVGIVLSTTGEQRQRIQRLGRILRKSRHKAVASMYYLLVEHTVEDPTLLEEAIETIAEFHLSYDRGTFHHPFYDEVAMPYLDRLHSRNAASEMAYRLIDLGRIRPDWVRDSETLRRLSEKAPTPFLASYYTVMRSLSLLRMGSDAH